LTQAALATWPAIKSKPPTFLYLLDYKTSVAAAMILSLRKLSFHRFATHAKSSMKSGAIPYQLNLRSNDVKPGRKDYGRARQLAWQPSPNVNTTTHQWFLEVLPVANRCLRHDYPQQELPSTGDQKRPLGNTRVNHVSNIDQYGIGCADRLRLSCTYWS
jgi:hypothetical protein